MGNQHTKSATVPRNERAFDYVRAHPGCTVHDVARSLAAPHPFVSMDLHHLRKNGRAYSERTPGERLVKWFAIEEGSAEEAAAEAPQVVIRKTWKPHHVRDAMVAAIHGPAPAQVAR